MGFIIVGAAALGKFFRFLAMVVFFGGALVTGLIVVFVMPFLDSLLGVAGGLFILGSWILLAFFLYGFMLLLAHLAEYIGAKDHPMMESDDGEQRSGGIG